MKKEKHTGEKWYELSMGHSIYTSSMVIPYELVPVLDAMERNETELTQPPLSNHYIPLPLPAVTAARDG